MPIRAKLFAAIAMTVLGPLVTVALGAGVLIVLLLVTAQDVVRLALERPARPGR